MDRVCKFIGTTHPRYNNGDIIEIQHGGDTNRKSQYSDEEWEALKASRLDCLKQNAIGNGIAEGDIQLTWEDAGSHNADHEAQINAYDESLKTYAEKRKGEYPSFGDQLDYIFHNGLDKWKADMILPIKERYPKP